MPFADERPVLGVDTIVVCDGEVLGKPADAADAERMLETLAGKTTRSLRPVPSHARLEERTGRRHA